MSFFMKEQFAEGVITKKNNNILVIKLRSQNCSTERKQNCDSGCGACSSINNVDKVTVFSPQAVNYKLGNEISFKYYAINDIFITLFGFGLPIGFSLLVLGMWFIKAPEKVESPLALLSALFGFLFGLILIWITDSLLRKRLPAQILTPPPKQ